MLIPTEVEFQSRRKQLKLLLVTLALLVWVLGRMTYLYNEGGDDLSGMLYPVALALAIIAAFGLSRRLVSPRRNAPS